MSHHDETFLRTPRKRILSSRPGTGSCTAGKIPFIVSGQGVVSFPVKKKRPFTWTIGDSDNTRRGLRLEVAADKVAMYELKKKKWHKVRENTDDGVGLDPDDDCQYWYSLDYHNRRIRYGKGEARRGTMLLNYDFPPVRGKKKKDPYAWVEDVQSVAVSPPVEESVEIWRDPVTTPPALFVVSPDRIAIDDVAQHTATVPANLTTTCQVLYDNVSGPNFQLNTPDFPDFVNAIEASIRDPKGWCHKTLKKKSSEFGGDNENETYLRITLGSNQGNSPGIPYVIEIWPPGHYSPIHDHGNSNAIIRVLSGEITVKLFAMLSPHHKKPFAKQVFRKDDVTWISADLNQVHQLRNHNTDGPTCITIQCYLYADSDTTHYDYFDYIADDEEENIEQFTPNSDMEYPAFKKRMKREWQARTHTGIHDDRGA